MTFPAAGSPADLALLLADHHGAALLVTAGHRANIETFFDRTRQQSNPSTFLTRLRVGEKVVDAKAVATLYHNRISGGAIALLILTMLISIIAALWVSRTDTVVLHWAATYWNSLLALVAALDPLGRWRRDISTSACDFAGRCISGAGGRSRSRIGISFQHDGLRIARRDPESAQPGQRAQRREERPERKAWFCQRFRCPDGRPDGA